MVFLCRQKCFLEAGNFAWPPPKTLLPFIKHFIDLSGHISLEIIWLDWLKFIYTGSKTSLYWPYDKILLHGWNHFYFPKQIGLFGYIYRIKIWNCVWTEEKQCIEHVFCLLLVWWSTFYLHSDYILLAWKDEPHWILNYILYTWEL